MTSSPNTVPPIRSVLLEALLPRLLLSGIFASLGHYGFGGDAEAYHIIGVYLKDLFLRPSEASLVDVIARWGWSDPEDFDVKYSWLEAEAESLPWFERINTSLPIAAIHAGVYALWEQPFFYSVLVSLLSAFATAFFVRSIGVARKDSKWLIYNPVSIYFASTHLKESLVESLILVFAGALFGVRRWRVVVGVIIAIGLLRPNYVPLVAIFLFAGIFRRVHVLLVLLAMYGAIISLPAAFWGHEVDSAAGAVYRFIGQSDFTYKSLGPLLGTIQPVPFLAASLDSIGGVFLTIYGLFYWYLLFYSICHILTARKPNILISASAVVGLLISYWVVGFAAPRARYFAPFLPLMILGVLQIRGQVNQWINRTFIRESTKWPDRVPAAADARVPALRK